MLNPTLVGIVNFFYPIGNTPAASLTQDIPLEHEAKVLVLGCGDVRNILYTTHCDSRSAKVDMTCCDIEGAIIARNILLFTILLDDTEGVNVGTAWDIYYHFQLDAQALGSLAAHARQLYQLSESLQKWQECSYGKALRFCDSGSLSRARSVWESYFSNSYGSFTGRAKTGNQSYIDRARDLRQQRLGSTYIALTGLRSAAPVMQHAIDDLSSINSHYWKHGTTDTDFRRLSETKSVNPTFASNPASTSIFHYSLDPLLGFHLSAAYAPISQSNIQKLHPSLEMPDNKAVSTAQSQFKQWSHSFKSAAGNGLVLRFYVGEATAFCHALHLKRLESSSKPNLYRGPNTFDVIDLDGSDYEPSGNAPLTFNVIDTSNLLDHIGAINLLVATSLLLEESASASIYMQSIVKTRENHRELANNLLCGDFQTMSTLLGLYSTDYWCNTSPASTAEETMWTRIAAELGDANRPTQMHAHFSWKRSMPNHDMKTGTWSPAIVRYEAKALAHTLSDIYKNMFAHEDLLQLLKKIDIHSIRNASAALYHRGNFAMFLRYLKGKAIVDDWKQMMTIFFGLVSSPTNDLHMQEFWLQLHLLGVHSVPALWDVPEQNLLHKRVGLETWVNMPTHVCVTLVVPRADLKIFTKQSPADLGTPPLQCSMTSGTSSMFGGWQNLYEMIQIAFGKIRTSGEIYSNSFQVHVSEDVNGWMDAFVALGIQSRPGHATNYVKSLGLGLNVFKTRLGNTSNVFVTRNFPNQTAYPFSWNFMGFDEMPSASSTQFQTTIGANLSATSRIDSFTGRIEMVSEKAKAALADRSANIETLETSPLSVTVKIGTTGLQHQLDYPAPVLLQGCKVKVARKSGYIEVLAPVANAISTYGVKDLMYPMFPRDDAPVLWNMPYLSMETLPILDLGSISQMQWLITHCSLMFSKREVEIRNSTTGPTKDVRVNFKDSLFSIFMYFSGLQGERGRQRLFGLCDPDSIGTHTLIFPSCLRLDPSHHSVVIDAAVIVLTDEVAANIRDLFCTLSLIGLCQIKVRKNEARLWRQVLPSYVERCRVWSHRPTCEYKTKSQIPLATEHGQTPFCSCGLGIFPKAFLTDTSIPHHQWKNASKYAVRVAISPAFFSPLVEEPQTGLPDTDFRPRKNEGCYVCGAEKAENGKALLRCGKCQTAKYCSAKCQKEDWKEHKKLCKK